MDPAKQQTSFYNLSPELRNNIYCLHFDATTKGILPTKTTTKASADDEGLDHPTAIEYVPTSKLDDAVQILYASALIYTEARGLFAEYCRGVRSSLQSRNAIYSFSHLPITFPITWTQGLHRVQLSAYGTVHGRLMLNPIKLAIRNDLLTTADYDTVAIKTLGINEKDWLRDIDKDQSITVTLKLAGADAKLDIKGQPTTGKIDIEFTGPIAGLDWSIIPVMRTAAQLEGWSRSVSRQVQVNQAFLIAQRSLAAQEVKQFMIEAKEELGEVLGKSETGKSEGTS
ncbi:hypothetical protein Q7P37_000434 [Cladosporium fusiforme]